MRRLGERLTEIIGVNKDKEGVCCPNCSVGVSKKSVIATVHGGNWTRRNVRCMSCDERYVTYEIPAIEMAKFVSLCMELRDMSDVARRLSDSFQSLDRLLKDSGLETEGDAIADDNL